MNARTFTAALLATSIGVVSMDASALNVRKEMRKQGCFKCHAISREKEGPPLRELSAKFNDMENGRTELREQLTTQREVEVDGRKEKHELFEADSPADIDELVDWILSL